MQKETTRKCIATGEILDKSLMLRFTVTPDGVVVPDFKKKLPGKGIYVRNGKSFLQKAVAGGLFAKAIKKPAKANFKM